MGPVQRDAGQVRQGNAGRRQGVADALLNLRVALIMGRPEFGRPAQILQRRKNAKAARTPGQVVVDPVRRLAGVTDDIEHVTGGEIEDRQPVEDFAPGHVHAVVAPPGNLPGARSALVAPDAKAVHEPPTEAGIGLEKAPVFTFDGVALMRSCTPSLMDARPFAALLDAIEQGFSGGDGCEDQRHA